MFRSQGDRGQCTTCGYVFLASEEFGMPSDTTLERELEVSSTESARILALELEPLSHMPDVEAPKHPDDRDEFQFFKDRLESALNDGAALYKFVDAGSRHRRAVLIAAIADRVVASLEIEHLLWD